MPQCEMLIVTPLVKHERQGCEPDRRGEGDHSRKVYHGVHLEHAMLARINSLSHSGVIHHELTSQKLLSIVHNLRLIVRVQINSFLLRYKRECYMPVIIIS